MSQSQFKVGFLCGSAAIKEWQRLCIEEVAQIVQVEIHLLWCELLISAPTPTLSPKKQKILKLIKKYATGPRRLWNVYYFLFVRNKIAAFRPIQDETFVKKFPSFKHTITKRGAYKYTFTAESLKEIEAQKYDVLINLELGFLTGDILKLPRHGVWSFHHGDEEKYRGLPPGFWEIYDNDPICGMVLQRLTEDLDSGYILEKGYVATHLRSYRHTLAMLFSVGHQWPAKICRQLLATDFSTLQSKSKTKSKLYRSPSNRQMIRFGFKILARNFKHLFTSYFFAERWRIGVIEKPLTHFIDHSTENLTPHWLPIREKSVFKADPFGFSSPSGPKIIFETFNYKDRVGKIASTRFDPVTKEFEIPKLEISKSFHLSFPFVFKHHGETFALVETYTEESLSYFKLTEDGQWAPYREVPSECFRNDNTLFEHEGLWYLFYTQGHSGANLRLNISYADNPFGPFQAHLLNPIKIDIRCARSAGALFKSDARIFRPAQNSVLGYGSSISLHEVLKLSPTEYEEVLVNEIKPAAHWGGFKGLHTLSALDDHLTLIDSQRPEWIWANIVQVFANRLRRFWR